MNYSHGYLLTYGYLIRPIKILSFWDGKIDPKNPASLLILKYFFKRFRFFDDEILGSLGQRAAKLPAFKIGGIKKKSAAWPWSHLNHSDWIRVCLGSNHSQSLTDSNFAALWPTDHIFSLWEDLILFSKYISISKDWQQFNYRFCSLKVNSFSYGLFSYRF